MSTQRVVRFGLDNALVGILTEPDAAQRIPGAPVVLLWNVGINHHVGPFRIFVDLARRLAVLGFAALRFDISGLGDSESARGDTRGDRERGIGDVKSAIDMLERTRGVERVVLLGFCSSVDPAHALSLEDPRVVGLAYLEGYYFKTPGYYLRYPLRYLNLNRWERLLRTKVERFFGDGSELAERQAIFVRDYPTAQSFHRDLKTLVTRGVRLLFIYVAGDSKYEYRDQLFDFLGSRELESKVELEFWPSADHTFFLAEDRARAVDRVATFVEQNFGTPQTAAAPQREDGDDHDSSRPEAAQ